MKKIKLLVLLFICFAVAGGTLYTVQEKSSHPVEECSNIFSSSLYPHYLKQLRTFLSGHPKYKAVKAAKNNDMHSLIKLIEAPVEDDQDFRTFHQVWVEKLRSLIDQSVNEGSSNPLLDDLIRWIYLEADLQSEIGTYFYAFSPVLEGDRWVYLKEARDRLRAEERFKGMEYVSLHEDNFLHGNLPYFLFSHPASSSTRILRMGHPVGDFIGPRYQLSSPVFYPEFLAFLRLQPSHLYVNLMKRNGLEGPGTRAIEELEGQCPNLYVVTMDKNSPFYWQDKKMYPDKVESEAFKVEFAETMTRRNENFFWSRRLDRGVWKEEIKGIISDVHQRYFLGKAKLNRAERQDFIELTYLAILDRLVEKWKPASVNISCRQGMDRGPSLAILWMHQKNAVEEGALPPMLLAPPLLIHNRPSHGSRIDRFVSAAKRMVVEDK